MKALARLSPMNLFKRQKKYPIPKQDDDMQALDNFALKLNSLSKLITESNHPIHKVSIECRKALAATKITGKAAFTKHYDVIDTHLANELTTLQATAAAEQWHKADATVTANKPVIDTILRIHFAREYFKRHRKAVADAAISTEGLTPEKFAQLFDVMLRGTASERIEAQLSMFGPELNQERLQECFYALYEPEVQTCTALFLQNPTLHPHHKKNLPVFAKTYLLDKHDLNMKLRCLLAWSDPKFSGFQTIEDTMKMTSQQLQKARRDYYEGGTEVGLQFMRDYVGARNQYYNDKAENRQTLRRGAVFFVATCLLDWLVCTI